MRLRVHCDEMAYGGAAAMAASLDVDAVDHCNFITDDDVHAIAERGIVVVACPATIAFLHLPQRAPVRALLEAGAQVALASDYNPGTSPCFNLQTVAYFGRDLFGLSAAEALYGVTRAAAHSLRADAGRLRVRRTRRVRRVADGVTRRVRLAVRRKLGDACRSMSSFAVLARWSTGRRSTTTRSSCATARSLPAERSPTCAIDAHDLEARSFPADRLVVPGFINGHSHAYQILLRGWADDLPFAGGAAMRSIASSPHLTPDDVYWTFVQAFSEMLAAGITTVAEFFYLNGAGNAHAEAAIRAARVTGIRLILGAHVDGCRRMRPMHFANRPTLLRNARSNSCNAIPTSTSASRRTRCTPLRRR